MFFTRASKYYLTQVASYLSNLCSQVLASVKGLKLQLLIPAPWQFQLRHSLGYSDY